MALSFLKFSSTKYSATLSKARKREQSFCAEAIELIERASLSKQQFSLTSQMRWSSLKKKSSVQL